MQEYNKTLGHGINRPGGDSDRTTHSSQSGVQTDRERVQMQSGNENDNQSDDTRDHGTTGNAQSEQGQPDIDEDFIDSGSVRTAAFDKGGEPRSPESLENRGTTQGSDDTPR